MVIKLYGSSTSLTGVDPWLWGTDKLTDGWLPLAYILLLLVVFPRLPLGQASPPTILSKRRRDPSCPGAHGPPQTLTPAGMRRAEI